MEIPAEAKQRLTLDGGIDIITIHFPAGIPTKEAQLWVCFATANNSTIPSAS